MSIEQKIAAILAESKSAEASDVEAEETLAEETVDETVETQEDISDETEEQVADEAAVEEGYTVDVQEDVAALVNGEDLSEEFKTKAATIFEAAIVTRVKAELAKLEEKFDARIQEEAAKNQEGLVEKVDGYLDYVVEQWINNNEIALEHGIKTEMMESLVHGLKTVFESHNIELPEEKFDVVDSLEEQVNDLQAKLDEQMAANVELTRSINEAVREAIVTEVSEGLAETDKEKFEALAEELTFEGAELFASKVQTIRENYFTQTTSTKIETVITDEPVVELTEEKQVKLDPRMAGYVSALKTK